MTVQELIAELQRHPQAMPVKVFIDWPEHEEEASGWFDLDRVRIGSGCVEVTLDD